jgi:Predicted GTPases
MAKQVKKGEREMYVIGCTNTGKSTFINSLIRNASIYEYIP